MFYKKGVLKNVNSQKNTCVRVFFIKKETLAQVLFCEFFKIFKSTFLQNTTGRLLLSGVSLITSGSLSDENVAAFCQKVWVLFQFDMKTFVKLFT